MPTKIEIFKRNIVAGILPNVLYRTEIGKETDAKIEALNDLMIREPKLSYVIYFNHLSYNDPLFAAYISHRIDPKGSRHLLVPVSYSHSDSENSRSKKYIALLELARQCGVENQRIVQSYQVDNPHYGYTRELAQSTYKAWIKRLDQLAKAEISVASYISPEGHRSDDGKLGPWEEGGLNILSRHLKRVAFIPLALDYPEPFSRDSLNFGSRISLSLGHIFIQETPRDLPGGEYLMKNLAAELPDCRK